MSISSPKHDMSRGKTIRFETANVRFETARRKLERKSQYFTVQTSPQSIILYYLLVGIFVKIAASESRFDVL